MASDPHALASLADWERYVTATTDGGLESLSRRTLDELPLQPLYTAADLPGGEGAETGWPRPERVSAARYPRPWGAGPALCSVVEAADPTLAGELIGEELRAGADGVWLRFDRTTRLGPESGDGGPSSDGVAVHHGTDLAAALAGLTGGERSAPRQLWLDAGANALPLAALWLADNERRALPDGAVAVHLTADPLAALARDGELPRDLTKLSSEMAALVRFCAGRLPGSSAIGVTTVTHHEAGADPVQELAFTVATLLEYVRRLADSGLSAAEVAASTRLRLAVGSQVFVEIAKLRAVRLLWRAALGAVGVAAAPAPILHVVGSRRTLTRRQPELNLLRGCEQAFSAACGGADAISVWGYDHARGAVSARARRLARNTALILRHEGLVSRVEDPGGGSFLVEALTRQLCERAWTLAQEIERQGGMSRLLLSGQVAAWVDESARRRARVYESGDAGITGVTHYVLDESEAAEPAPAAAAPEAAAERLERHRSTWSAPSVEIDYSRDFVVEELLARARRGETVAELGARLGDGESAERAEALTPRRDAAPFEEAL